MFHVVQSPLNCKENTPNVPQARPIEKFWAIMKQKYKARKNPAKNLAKNMSVSSAQQLMKEARRYLRLIAYKGVRAPLKARK